MSLNNSMKSYLFCALVWATIAGVYIAISDYGLAAMNLGVAIMYAALIWSYLSDLDKENTSEST